MKGQRMIKKLKRKVERKYILDPRYGCFIFKIPVGKDLRKSVSEKPQSLWIICNFFHVKLSYHGRESSAVLLQGMAAGQDHACMNTGTNKTRMHGNIFSNVFIDRQSGASKDNYNRRMMQRDIQWKMGEKELTFS